MGATDTPTPSDALIPPSFPPPPPPETSASSSVPGNASQVHVSEAPPLPSGPPSRPTVGPPRGTVLASLLAPAMASLANARPWREETFPFAWFLTPIFDFVHPDSLVFLAGYSSVNTSSFPGVPGAPGNEPVPREPRVQSTTPSQFPVQSPAWPSSNPNDTPAMAARKTISLGSILVVSGILTLLYPSFPTFITLRVCGAAMLFGSVIFFVSSNSISDFCFGLNCIWLGLIFLNFRGFGGFLFASTCAFWMFLKGIYRSCLCLSTLASFVIFMSSFFTSSVVGFLVGYDTLLCGMRIYATGKRMAEAEGSSAV